MSPRKIIFWLHLVAGVVAGIVILVMSLTGAALAFEKEIIAWADADARRVVPPADAKRLPLDDLLAKFREEHPNVRPSGITIDADPTVAVLASLGRTNGFYLNPHTAEVRPQGASKTRAFMATMIEWHRYVGRRDDTRPAGKAITGACNVAFCFLAVSGLYLWWPRQWSKGALRGVALFNWSLRGKARDWNWHNVIGLWSAPVLVVLTATAMPISYRWASDLIYKVTRSEAPAPPASAASIRVPVPPAGATPMQQEALLQIVQKEVPAWSQITLRPAGGSRGNATAPDRARGERSGPQPVTFAVKVREGAPRFATAQVSLDPFTGEVLRADTYAGYNLGRRVRTWSRFLHTGEALGGIGQLVAGIASLGGAVLVYTGLSLALRRFLRRGGSGPTLATRESMPAAETRP